MDCDSILLEDIPLEDDFFTPTPRRGRGRPRLSIERIEKARVCSEVESMKTPTIVEKQRQVGMLDLDYNRRSQRLTPNMSTTRKDEEELIHVPDESCFSGWETSYRNVPPRCGFYPKQKVWNGKSYIRRGDVVSFNDDGCVYFARVRSLMWDERNMNSICGVCLMAPAKKPLQPIVSTDQFYEMEFVEVADIYEFFSSRELQFVYPGSRKNKTKMNTKSNLHRDVCRPMGIRNGLKKGTIQKRKDDSLLRRNLGESRRAKAFRNKRPFVGGL